jgi:hypothetical protein
MIQAQSGSGYTYRWSLVEGQPRCLEDALPPNDPGVPVALAHTKAIDDLLEAVAVYEDAQRVPEPAEDEDRTAWDAAQSTIQGASAAVEALALWRAGDTDQELAVTTAIAGSVNIALDADLPGARDAKIARVDEICAEVLSSGYTPKTGPLAGQTLQTRDNTDRTNWLTSQAAYLSAVMTGAGAAMGANFRTQDNKTITMSYADGLGNLLGMAAWGAAVMGRSWTLKDALRAATSVDAIDAIDIESGWPA